MRRYYSGHSQNKEYLNPEKKDCTTCFRLCAREAAAGRIMAMVWAGSYLEAGRCQGVEG